MTIFEEHNTNKLWEMWNSKQVGVVLKKTGGITDGHLKGNLQVGYDCRKAIWKKSQVGRNRKIAYFSAEKGTLCLYLPKYWAIKMLQNGIF